MPYEPLLPKVVPHQLQWGPVTCARLLRAEYDARPGRASDIFTRWRVRDALLTGCSVTHAAMAVPKAADFVPVPDFVPEERAVFDRAAAIYLAFFGAEAAEALDHGCQYPTKVKSRGVRLGGGIDLLVKKAGEGIELRQFELWGKTICADPMQNWTILAAVLRLSHLAGQARMSVVHVDLVGGAIDQHVVDYAVDLRGLVQRFDDRLAELRSRMADPVPSPGRACGMCGYIADCPALVESA